ncbi:hypothetical protein ACF5W4_09940 [Bacillota bacterium Lsc_1132]
MSFKGFFNKGDSEENEKNSLIEFEKQIRRINTLEVHINRLLKLEARLGPLLLLKEQLEAAKKTSSLQKNDSSNIEIQNQFLVQNQEIEKLKQQVAKLEQEKQQKYSRTSGTRKEEDLSTKLYSCVEDLQTKINGLETNLLLVNQLQIDILKQLESARKQWNELQQRVTAISADGEQNVIQKEIYIDKLFLEKYEQNNNIAQVGIKELSGVLNIGATYGTIPLPGGTSETPIQEEKVEAEEEPFDPAGTETEQTDSFTDIPIEDSSELNQDSSES